MADLRCFFDIRSLSLTNGLISFTLMICMLYTSKSKTYPGFKKWTLATVFTALGFITLSLRGIAPDFISVIISNILLICTYFLISRGLDEFTENRQNNKIDIFLAALYLATLVFNTYLRPDTSARVILFSLVSGYYSFRCAKIIHSRARLFIGKDNWLLLAGFIVICFWFFLRAFITFLGGFEITDLMSPDIFQATIFIVGYISHIIIMTGLIILNSQRLDFDLRKAKENLKSLRGLLPICASCKKIRDDRGYWNQIEYYIKTHTDADFSHGLCPDCARVLYPEIDETNEQS